MTISPSMIDKNTIKTVIICLNRSGGTLKCASSLAFSLNKFAKVEMIVSSNSDLEILPESIKLHYINTGHTRFENIIQSINPFNYIKIINIIEQINPDIVHFPVEHVWHLFLYRRLNKYPIVQTIHDPVRHHGEENIFYDFVRYVEVIKSDRIIVLSKIFKKCFENIGVSGDKVDVIPHGSFTFSDRSINGQRFPPPPLNKNILFAGRISPYKGIDILIAAFAELKIAIPDATLTIAGNGDLSPYKVSIDRTKNVSVINRYLPEDELVELHKLCDFVVAPYIDASQSGVVSMALSNGRTVVATNVGGLPEQIIDGKTGFIVEPDNIKQLAEAMKMLLMDTTLLLKMSIFAKEEYDFKYNWDTIAKTTMDSYQITIKSFIDNKDIKTSKSLFSNLIQFILLILGKGLS